jgi:hypothetical protein
MKHLLITVLFVFGLAFQPAPKLTPATLQSFVAHGKTVIQINAGWNKANQYRWAPNPAIKYSELSLDEFPELKSSSRFAFSTQLPISRKFSNSFSMELNPIYIHKNLYEPLFEEKDNFLLALGGRYKLSKRISLNMEYAARLNARETSFYHNPATIGIDIETGGHVFQLVFSNSQAMNDVSYFTNANGITEGKGIYFGFNMYRVF